MDTAQLSTIVKHIEPQMIAWRRDFHQFAESGWLEYRTASVVADILDKLGYQLQLGQEVFVADARMGLPAQEVMAAAFERAREQGAIEPWLSHFANGFTGIVATLDSGKPGPTIGYRVDMDALDLDEVDDPNHIPSQAGFGSVNERMMHACGHDGHTAIGLGLATLLAQTRAEWSGCVKIIFQPAEEGTRGAKSMALAGVVDDVDYFTAIHIGTGIAQGQMVCANDSFMATSKLDVTFTGIAAHAGGNPEQGRSALLAAAQATLALHAINRHSEGASRINVGVLNAGTGRNIIAPSALLKVETRGQNNTINNYIYQQAKQIIQGVATMYGVDYTIKLVGAAQSSVSSPEWISFIQQQAQASGRFSAVHSHSQKPAGSEDATYFMERVKACGGQAAYSIFGTQLAAGHHNEHFDFNEIVLSDALHTLAMLTLNFDQFKSES
ncbi:amidohydrolase [Celerinatantimonas yamalensis]|uniref:Amidohydrolase n=1 Tax=Celerinatantimonas yamalensis TaxID=559956 RepID=A0ABW9G7J3_9GAMM